MRRDEHGNLWCDSEYGIEVCVSLFMRRVATIAEMRFFAGLLSFIKVDGITSPGHLLFTAQGANLVVAAQITIGSTRADFVLGVRDREGSCYGRLLVEIDDPSHWRDPEKAAADRVRDRYNLGHSRRPTMRFSNEEVIADPKVCARQALSYCVDEFFLESTREEPESNPSLGAPSTGEAPN